MLRIVKEAKQVGILYHFTSSIEKIINDGLILKSANFSGFSRFGNEYGNDFISFTRNFNLSKTSPYFKNLTTRIILNGDILSDRYKIIPIDALHLRNDEHNESEERIYSKTVDIKKALIRIDIIADFYDMLQHFGTIEKWKQFNFIDKIFRVESFGKVITE